MASPGAVFADKITGGSGQVSPVHRRLLRVGSSELIGFRHVWLQCGDHVLSEATLWYVPGRLRDAMNQQLRETSIPLAG
jgi:hypothetical protein